MTYQYRDYKRRNSLIFPSPCAERVKFGFSAELYEECVATWGETVAWLFEALGHKRDIPSSIPGGVLGNAQVRIQYPCGPSQLLTEMSTKEFPLGINWGWFIEMTPLPP